MPTGPHVVASARHYPPYVAPDTGDLALALLFWEETLSPSQWLKRSITVSRALAPSSFVAKTLIDFAPPSR